MHNLGDGDPHDLTFYPKHVPRASMVDNLAMSLDQFSSNSDTSRTLASRTPTLQSTVQPKSTYVTSVTEARNQPPRETPVAEAQPADDSAKEHITARGPTTLSEEEESQREKAYNAQRAMQTTRSTSSRGNALSKSRSASNSSSIDLGHLATYAGKLGVPGNRRSQSFDFGSVRPKRMADANDATMASTFHQSSEGLNALGITTSGQSVVRRNSGRSTNGTQARKGRTGTTSAANSRTVTESPQPRVPTKSHTTDTNDYKPSSSVQLDQTPTPRAGFFRRVFGSSSRSNTAPSSYPSPSRPSYEHASSNFDSMRPETPVMRGNRNATEGVHNKENQPTITKKPSSFFRRRKKSISGGVPPPLPLTLNNNSENTKLDPGASSPVSSLRAFMDPYLGEAAGNTHKRTRGSSLQGIHPLDQGKMKGIAANQTRQPKIDNNDADRNATPTPNQNSVVKDKPIIQSVNKQAPPPNAIALESRVPVRGPDSNPVKSKSSTSALDQSTANSLSPNRQDNIRSKDGSPNKTKQLIPPSISESQSPGATIKVVPQSSGSDTSDYRSAPSTPLVTEMPDPKTRKSPIVRVSHPSVNLPFTNENVEQARRIFHNIDENVTMSNACAWLGESSNEHECVRLAYMSLFDWNSLTILAALRNLCSKLVLKGETQQVDRVLDAFATRWCECNNNHGFKSTDVVHTICYSILLLNTDLHLADIVRKMTKPEFVRNAMDAILGNLGDIDLKHVESGRPPLVSTNSQTNAGSVGPSMERIPTSMSTTRPNEPLSREESYDDGDANLSGPLVEAPFTGSQNDWELQVELVLKEIYQSISREPLPLFGSQSARPTPQQSTNNLSALSTLRRTPSTISKSTSDTRARYTGESRSLGARWASKARPRPRLGTSQGFASSRTSIEDQSSGWSPSMSSTWSRVSLNKTLTSMSVESFGQEHIGGGYPSSIGFANALSQAIIRDEHVDDHTDDGMKAAPLLEDESLELYGAPWAKEGILKHKCHLDGPDKRSKDRNWNDCFAVIEKGWMRLFSFSMTAKSLRNKARNHKAGAVVGGGNWQDNAEEVWKFMLRHTIASSLPPPGYSKQRPYVWALSLPNGAVHLFSVGTPDIVKEFVTTANFWSARLSKEPMTGGISSMEYGWSDTVVSRALIGSDSHPGFHTASPRPSTQLSMRSSIDHGSIRPRLPGDKVHISEWVPPQQSLVASQLLEIDQMKALQVYVKNVEEELQKHNELRAPMLLAFSSRHPNSQRAMTNWEKKSSYLLREIIKFQTYMDALSSAQATKDKVDKMKKERQVGNGGADAVIAKAKATATAGLE